jgi:adenylate cyclase
MNAPPNIVPTADSDGDLVHWLTNGTREQRFLDNIFAELCGRIQRSGIPLKRATLHILIQHPQWLGARMLWADGMREAELARVDFDVRERSEYIGSPATKSMTARSRCGKISSAMPRSAAGTRSMTRCGRTA